MYLIHLIILNSTFVYKLLWYCMCTECLAPGATTTVQVTWRNCIGKIEYTTSEIDHLTHCAGGICYSKQHSLLWYIGSERFTSAEMFGSRHRNHAWITTLPCSLGATQHFCATGPAIIMQQRCLAPCAHPFEPDISARKAASRKLYRAVICNLGACSTQACRPGRWPPGKLLEIVNDCEPVIMSSQGPLPINPRDQKKLHATCMIRRSAAT